MSPYLLQLVTDIERVVANTFEYSFVMEVKTEDARMVVCSIRFLPVFPARVVFKWPDVLSKSFEEFLKVGLVQAPKFREILVIVRECNETGFVMELLLVYHSDSPLPRLFKAASDALPAR